MNAPASFQSVASHAAADVACTAEEAIVTRRSVRGFLPDPVPLDLVRHILEVSARAPSGTNMQPWVGHVVTGSKLKALCDAVCDAHFNSPEGHTKEYKYYPDQFFEPYLGRRRTVGFGLYNMAGIARGDTAGMRRQSGRNYTFFDAPVGLMFTIDKRLEIGSWLDYGMFLQNIMTVARQYGLHTCPQAAWPTYHRVVRQVLGFPEDHTLVCGIALGYEDTSVPENALRTDREPVDGFMTFHTD